MTEQVNHPDHYNAHPSGVECIDIVEHMTFNTGNAVKYAWRSGLKTPDPLTDLRKAIWYLQREIERLTRDTNQGSSNRDGDSQREAQDGGSG